MSLKQHGHFKLNSACDYLARAVALYRRRILPRKVSAAAKSTMGSRENGTSPSEMQTPRLGRVSSWFQQLFSFACQYAAPQFDHGGYVHDLSAMNCAAEKQHEYKPQRLELGAAEVIGGKQKMHEQSGKMKHTTCGIRHGDRCRGKAVRLASFTITPYREQIIATHIAAAHRSGMLPSGNAARFLGVLRTSNDQLALRELGAEWSRRQAAAVRVAATSVRSRGPKSPLADRTSSSVSPA